MFKIEPVTLQSDPEVLKSCRRLFRLYGEFLNTQSGPALFCFSGLEEEIANVPARYSEHGGEVLLATAGLHAAGCIAYRRLSSSESTCCEIKRLFVNPQFRGRGLGKLLVSVAI